MNHPKYFYGVIYKITNLMNNKCYIGYTSNQNPENYIQKHFRDALNGRQSNKYFYSAIRKYGEKNFKKEILGFCYSVEEMLESEIECIYFFRSFGSDGESVDNIYGYNLTKGGDGAPGRTHSEKTIKKMSEARDGKVMLESSKEKLRVLYKDKTYEEIHEGKEEEIKKKISVSLKKSYAEGRRVSKKGKSYVVMYGEERAREIKEKQRVSHLDKKHSEESIERMRIVQKGKIISKEQRAFLSNFWLGSKKMTKDGKIKIIKKCEIEDCLNKGWKFCKKIKGVLVILDS